MPTTIDVFTMPIDELRKRVAQVLVLLIQIDELLPGLVELTTDGRQHASRFRDGEAEALKGLLDIADEKPAFFEVLADKDGGADPTKFEPDVIRDRLERTIILGPVVKEAEALARPLSDTLLHLTTLAKPVLLAMYAIVKPQAKNNVAIATLARPILDLYQAVGRAAAASRKKKTAPTD
ncbi:MAG: hypothetical protein WCI05_06055 [Myxococcales bacterium]